MAMGFASSSRRGRGRGSRRTPMAEINVTPLVDVMLVLLIIFMVTAPLLASGVPVELPDSRANPLDQDPDQITIAIDENGFIYIDDVLVERGQFAAQLEPIDCQSPQPPLITLRADTALDYGRVMAVMGELNRAGCNSISLVTNSSDSQP
jgi:biopolymer transport protein TolR